jgi:isoquinoline 1-oxidoreductase subunit beta
MSHQTLISRRSLLAAGGLLIAIGLPTVARGQSRENTIINGLLGNLGAFLHISSEGTVTFISPTAEIGQGAYTAEAQIIAEELGCTFDSIRVIAAPADEGIFLNPMMHMQVTASSSGIRGFFDPLRRAGASARIRLIGAAAKIWDVEPEACEAIDGHVIHKPTGRIASFGELAAAASREPDPDLASLILKKPSAYQLIGHNVPRLDVRSKADGTAVYGIDVVRPGMKFAALGSSALIGGHLIRVNPAPALAVPGVLSVIPLATAVAVVAEHSWAAIKGLSMLDPIWAGGDPTLSDDKLENALLQSSRTDKPIFSKSDGDVEQAISKAHDHLAVEYTLPFLSHAQMEPLNCVVDLGPEGCDIWVGTQASARVQAAAADTAGLPAGMVRVHNQMAGGGFGRRAETEDRWVGRIASLAARSLPAFCPPYPRKEFPIPM